MKEKIKQLLPRGILYLYSLLSAIRIYLPDIRRRVRDKVYHVDTPDKLFRDLTVAYHIIEKGLTMPEPRPGFGKGVVLNLAGLALKHDRLGYSREDVSFRQAVSVLKEYREFHRKIEFTLDGEVEQKLQLVEERFPGMEGEHQLRLSREDYFADAGKAFDRFCRSRYSVRNYSPEPIPMDVLHQCIALAQRSPSFCNRQPSRVHIVKSPEKKEAILALQNGNRGFGHLAETLLVVTSNVSMANDLHERHENHFNSGMFSMTLLNALHFYRIGACSLNWSASKERDASLRKLLDVPDNEEITLVISCGYLPGELSIASSPRKALQEIIHEHL